LTTKVVGLTEWGNLSYDDMLKLTKSDNSVGNYMKVQRPFFSGPPDSFKLILAGMSTQPIAGNTVMQQGVYYLSKEGSLHSSYSGRNDTVSTTNIHTSIRVLSLMGLLPTNPLPNYGMCFHESELFETQAADKRVNSIDTWFVIPDPHAIVG
jgi:hypothetical protein